MFALPKRPPPVDPLPKAGLVVDPNKPPLEAVFVLLLPKPPKPPELAVVVELPNRPPPPVVAAPNAGLLCPNSEEVLLLEPKPDVPVLKSKGQQMYYTKFERLQIAHNVST